MKTLPISKPLQNIFDEKELDKDATVSKKEIVGVILSRNDGRRGYIHHTVVAVSERKSGIGSALVDATMKALKEEGINELTKIV